MQTDEERSAAATPAAPPAAGAACANCGTPLLGEHCYACGQPVRGLVRHFSSIIGDFFDSVFELDSRIFCTLAPLFFRPGRLSTEYFAGRRVRYVSPVRLYVFLSLIAFFVAQVSMDFEAEVAGGSTDREVAADVATSDLGTALRRATTVEEAERARDAALAEIRAARDDTAAVPGVGAALTVAEETVERSARERIEALRDTDARAPGPDAPAAPAAREAADDAGDDPVDLRFGNGENWDPVTNPLEIAGAPDFVNRWVNRQIGRAQHNIPRIRDNPGAFADALVGAIPTTLFVLLPVFALMLKTAYLFKRRLYMEHLIVALHSHAFLCMALLVGVLLYDLQSWLGTRSTAAQAVFGLLQAALYAWIPIYLLLAQKRIYAQGWPMTLLKYFVIGNLYVMLLSMGLVAASLTSLVAM